MAIPQSMLAAYWTTPNNENDCFAMSEVSRNLRYTNSGKLCATLPKMGITDQSERSKGYLGNRQSHGCCDNRGSRHRDFA
jgi:hypothetical protein